MVRSNLQGRIVSWLAIAVAVVLVANLVWSMVKALLPPAVVAITIVTLAVVWLRWWRHRNFF